jgi:hypothetical protein
MKIIISENQYNGLIKESKFKNNIQNQLDEILQMLKDAVETEPRDFTTHFSNNIDNVESFKIVNIDRKTDDNVRLIINVVITLDTEISFGKWGIIAEILSEVSWAMKEQLKVDVVLKLSDEGDGGVVVLNKMKDW